MKKHTLRAALCAILVVTVLTAFVAIAVGGSSGGSQVGTPNDPLVTLSYLNETFFGQIMAGVDGKLEIRNSALSNALAEEIARTKREILIELGSSYSDETGGTAVSFTTVTLTAGQTLYGGTGCEILLRSGSATCVSDGKSVPGLVDTTDSVTINHGSALLENHLYMMTDQRGVFAATDIVLLVRGEYIIM